MFHAQIRKRINCSNHQPIYYKINESTDAILSTTVMLVIIKLFVLLRTYSGHHSTLHG